MVNKDATAYVYGGTAVLLLLCLFNIPYSFYVFARFAAAAAFGYFAYKANESSNKDRMILFIVLAVLFQPFIKTPLGRVIWNIVDVVIAGYLFFLLLRIVRE